MCLNQEGVVPEIKKFCGNFLMRQSDRHAFKEGKKVKCSLDSICRERRTILIDYEAGDVQLDKNVVLNLGRTGGGSCAGGHVGDSDVNVAVQDNRW